MHDPRLTDNPPLPAGGKRTRPFDFQDKVHNQSQPGIVDFIARIRSLTDSYGGRFSVAEVGGDHAEREMQAFTSGETHLNSAYGFLYLYAPALVAGLVREGAEAWHGRDGQGWPSWTFSNHDAPRASPAGPRGAIPRPMPRWRCCC